MYQVNGIDFNYTASQDISGWYHVFTDANNEYSFSFNSELYEQEEAWVVVEESMKNGQRTA